LRRRRDSRRLTVSRAAETRFLQLAVEFIIEQNDFSLDVFATEPFEFVEAADDDNFPIKPSLRRGDAAAERG
jgi:hypothetical protein